MIPNTNTRNAPVPVFPISPSVLTRRLEEEAMRISDIEPDGVPPWKGLMTVETARRSVFGVDLKLNARPTLRPVFVANLERTNEGEGVTEAEEKLFDKCDER